MRRAPGTSRQPDVEDFLEGQGYHGAQGRPVDQGEQRLDGADGVLLDTLAVSALGGTGVAFDWQAVHGEVRDLRFGRRLIVAGGLNPGNVREAIERLAPDVVDVSSGVESTPGVKNHQRMAEFMTAVRQSVQ